MPNWMMMAGLGLITYGARREAESRARAARTLGAARSGAMFGPDPTGAIRGQRQLTVNSLEARVGLILQNIREGSLSPNVIAAARRIVSQVCGDRYCVKEKDYEGEVDAIFNAIRNPRSEVHMRYVRDHATVDQFATAEASMRMHAGDCDEMVSLIGALARAIGYPVRARVIATTDVGTWSHIYPLVGLPPQNPTRWKALDATEPHPAGWEVDGAQATARTGQPSGMVLAVRDFDA